ncbi:kinesin-like protein KIN-7N isoform X2 [Beta vulgaris subsp. vulgaris]|uniref:kinesin-like protein KIN-7N isoform X2 n=1 Tax=Beta vulgaris subsp. vulgaris TaxID=3555 RepID=UPI002036C3FE|nr:kinesin-like protein KIN-7N isoform X2 [Beta vulgaris subsp. vulgaris]
MEKICVAVRVRPPVSLTLESNNGTFWNVDDKRISLHKSTGTPFSGVVFSFDHVFDQSCPNSRVYELLTKDIIYAAIEGFNGTVFAYGQTSSGKTFTMNGSENDPGIIHRAVKDVFDMISKDHERDFLIRVSYMEIYNEEINDLLAVNSQKLPIHESLERGVFVAGLREEFVSNAEQVHKLLEAGEVNRHFGETNMNVRSSRSHTIFRMVIESKNKEMDGSSSDAIRVSVLNLVDLAGSERIAKTGADGVRLKEGKHINKSLMVLGNVINKLSEGAKQRAHIPYRDSKLTRILQSSLGGNAKTSIICTVAPEEVHVEETRGTLQFANRAKCVTNCAQVNEILTDAALLKRQKLEIEELRQKLQGSRAEVLEQEILKLRNDLLKYELEHEKLAMELEEERTLHRQRNQHIKEQQIRIDNLSNIVHFSDSDQKSHTQKQGFSGKAMGERSNDSHHIWQEEAFSTPSFKAAPNSFVARRSNYAPISDSDSSPAPDAFNNVADEDAWMKLNKGFVADLDSLHITPAVKVRSLSSNGGFLQDRYEHEIQNLKRQMDLTIKERDELEKNHQEQVLLNEKLTNKIMELHEEVKLTRGIPQVLCESVATCRDTYKDVLTVMQSSVNDEKSFAKNLLTSLTEIGTNLFSTLETHCKMAVDGHKLSCRDTSLVQEPCKILCEQLNNSVAFLESPDAQSTMEKELTTGLYCSDYKGINLGGEPACWKEKLSNELNTFRDKYISLEKDLDQNSQVLEESNSRYLKLEQEYQIVQQERDSLLDEVSKSSQNFTLVSEERETLLERYKSEVQKRKNLEQGIKQFSEAFASRHKSLASFHSDFKSRVEDLRSHNPVVVINSLGL